MGDLNARVDRLLTGLDSFREKRNSVSSVVSDEDGGWMAPIESRYPSSLAPRARDSSGPSGAKSVSWASEMGSRPRLPSVEEDYLLTSGQSPLRSLLDGEVHRLLSSSSGISRYMMDDMVHQADQLWREREVNPSSCLETRWEGQGGMASVGRMQHSHCSGGGGGGGCATALCGSRWSTLRVRP